VPLEEKRTRLKAVDELQARIQAEINGELLAQTVEVLVEGEKAGRTHGRNRNDKIVYLDDGHERIGEVVEVKIEKTGPWSLQGSLV
jgi:tRNA-2-methylthio-N6-dimethylallyladenosine synthase